MGNRTTYHLSLYYSDSYLLQRRARFCPNLYHHTPPPSSGPARSDQPSQETSLLRKGANWAWERLERIWRFLKCVFFAFRVNPMDVGNKKLPDGNSTATSGPASGSGGTSPLPVLELWFKGCHSGMCFIRAMSSEPVWDLELYLWLYADCSQLTLRYTRCRWRKHGRHKGRLEG